MCCTCTFVVVFVVVQERTHSENYPRFIFVLKWLFVRDFNFLSGEWCFFAHFALERYPFLTVLGGKKVSLVLDHNFIIYRVSLK